MKTKIDDFLVHTIFLTMISIKFVLLLQKGVYPCEYMDDWEIFSKTILPEKEDFYSHPNMQDITDYAQQK